MLEHYFILFALAFAWGNSLGNAIGSDYWPEKLLSFFICLLTFTAWLFHSNLL